MSKNDNKERFLIKPNRAGPNISVNKSRINKFNKSENIIPKIVQKPIGKPKKKKKKTRK
jgi:hypothetical protein